MNLSLPAGSIYRTVDSLAYLCMDSEHDRLKMLRHARIRRVKQLLRWLPRRTNIQRYPVLKWFSERARKHPFLWSFKVANTTPAFYAGSIIAFLPLYGIQLGLAFFAAVFFRANLPILCGLQLLSNPLSVPIIYPLNFFVGKRAIHFFAFGGDPGNWANWFNSLMVGGFIIGLIFGAVIDCLYRVAAWQAATQYQRIKAHRETTRHED